MQNTSVGKIGTDSKQQGEKRMHSMKTYRAIVIAAGPPGMSIEKRGAAPRGWYFGYPTLGGFDQMTAQLAGPLILFESRLYRAPVKAFAVAATIY